MTTRYAVALMVITLAFFLRVLGQAIVAFGDVTFLPPMEQWQSGLLPYPLLLCSQVVILALQTKASLDIWRDRGYFAARRPCAGLFLRRFSYVYFAVMALRYIVTMAVYPDRRWLSGTIPIFFHFVLAGYLWILGTHMRRVDDKTPGQFAYNSDRST